MANSPPHDEPPQVGEPNRGGLCATNGDSEASQQAAPLGTHLAPGRNGLMQALDALAFFNRKTRCATLLPYRRKIMA